MPDPGEVDKPLGAADQHHRHRLVHLAGLRGQAQDRREAARRQGGLDPQGPRLDAEGDRKAGRSGPGEVSGRALPGDAQDDAPIRHRAVTAEEVAGVHGQKDENTDPVEGPPDRAQKKQ